MHCVGNTVAELAANERVPQAIREYVLQLVSDVLESEGPDSFEQDATFEEMLGGGVYVVERPEDLSEIETVYGSSLLDCSGVFDLFSEITGGYYVVAVCSTSNGGTTFFIPPEFVTANVIESARLTKIEQTIPTCDYY